MTAAPVNNPNAAMTNREVVANRAELRLANLSAAAALKAQMNESSEQEPPMVQKGTKRTAEEAGVDDTNDEENEEDASITEDEPDTFDPVEAGKAILKRVADEKKQKDDAAREREPDDEVR